ncbi:MAG: endolytic transglycosylase MltG, partial [Gemmiger sp.]
MKKKDYEEDYEEYEDEEYEDEPRRRFPFGIIILVLFLALLAGGVFMLMQWYREVDGTGAQGAEQVIMIEDGASAGQIAAQLADEGIVKTEWLFKLYAKYSGKANDLQPGDVTLRAGMSYNEILKAISTQRVFRQTVTVTFPEGYTAVAIAQLMEQNGLCSAD